MYFLIAVPVIFLASLIHLIAERFKMKFTMMLCKVVIFAAVLFFIYYYLAYRGFDIISYVRKFLGI